MISKRLYKFRLRCVVEDVFLEHWAESEPENCPHNAAHALDHAQTTVLDAMVSGSVEVKIREEEAESTTGGHFKRLTRKVVVPAAQPETVLDISWPYPVSLLAATYFPEAASVGDELEVQVAPDTVVGALTLGEIAGATVLRVSASVLDNIKRGFFAKVGDLDVGFVTDVDKVAGTITVSTPLSADAAPGSLVKMTVKFSCGLRLNSTDPQMMGDTKMGSSFLPTGKAVRLIYKNINGNPAAKMLPFDIELLY